ncbi:MAG: hypothetical protein AB8V23_04620 [Candidatus Midichloria sp.]
MKHPVIAVGGINELNVVEVIIAAIGVFHDTLNPEQATKKP